MKRHCTLWSLVACGFFALGCADSSGGKKIANLVPVEGTVSLDGTPVSQGMITFAPDDPKGQPATSQIQSGKFKMMTTVSAPGVVAGDYKIRIVGIEQTAAAPTDVKKSNPDAPGGIPKKYGDVATSELKATVKSGMAPLAFELK